MALRLLVLSGPAAGCEFAVQAAGLAVGRSRSCDAVVADRSLSRRHFRVALGAEGLQVEDIGSSNGTFLDGRRVQSAPLVPGAIVTAGGSDFTVLDDGTGGSEPSVGPAPATTAIVSADAVGRLFGDSTEHRDLVVLYRTARRLPACETLAALGHSLLAPLVASLHGTEAALYLMHGSSPGPEVARVTNEDGLTLPPPTRALLEAVAADGRGQLTESDGVTALTVPLPSRGDVTAVAWVAAAGSPGWDSRDLVLAAALGEIAGPAVANLLARTRPAAERGRMHRTLREAAGILGESEAMRAVIDTVARLAAVDTATLVLGETGTGKELVARALHYNGHRAGGPFVAVNCAALAEDVVDSELFGHEKGAFTGATTRRRGRFELASGGTLFPDEVAELPLPQQAKLLRVLETGEFHRVGGEQAVRVDVRLVAATNRDLHEAVATGLFRRDLLFRLNVAPLTLPPLRKRPADIPLLLDHFLAATSREAGLPAVPTVTDEAAELLCAYPWPGNVRELRNVVEQCVVLADDGVVGVEVLPERVARGGRRQGEEEEKKQKQKGAGSALLLRDVEADHIQRVLDFAGGNKKQAAELLGIERATLYAKIKRYGLRTDCPFRRPAAGRACAPTAAPRRADARRRRRPATDPGSPVPGRCGPRSSGPSDGSCADRANR